MPVAEVTKMKTSFFLLVWSSNSESDSLVRGEAAWDPMIH
jgi:hypothetical protein